MLTDPAVRKSIVASIIASVVVIIFIQPLLTCLWSVIVQSSNYLAISYANSIYKSAALGHRNNVDVFILSFILLMLFIPSFSFLLYLFISKKSSQVSHKYTKIKMILSNILFLVGTLIVLSHAFFDLQLNTSFQQRLTVLAPALSEQEEKEFKAAWASMLTREDFLSIINKMQSVAAERKIILPELLYK